MSSSSVTLALARLPEVDGGGDDDDEECEDDDEQRDGQRQTVVASPLPVVDRRCMTKNRHKSSAYKCMTLAIHTIQVSNLLLLSFPVNVENKKFLG